MPEQERRTHYLVLPLAALIAVAPLLVHGCSCGHDFDFHILSWFEAARQFAHGNLHPHWAYTPAFNAGEPRFVFYPPISWTLGAILGLILPWTWTPIVYTWLALTGAGFSLYSLAKEFATRKAALIAATFYLVNPYTLFTAYERTAYAELLAAAWIPLLLHAILREKVTMPRIAIPVALLWLTNAPAAVMSCYALALLTIVRIATTRGGVLRAGGTTPARLALTNAAGTLLGLGLAAFYIVPAAYERRYVQISMAILPGMRIQDNFLFHHTADPDHDYVLHTASVVAIVIIVITATALLAAKRATKNAAGPDAPFAAQFYRNMIELSSGTGSSYFTPLLTILTLLAATIIFLLTPISAPIWNHLPDMRFLQFPWRILAILAAVAALAVAIALSPLKLKSTPAKVTAIILAASLSAIAYRTFHQSCDDDDTVSGRLALFHSNAGTDPTDEYTPITADNDALSPNNPPYWLALDPDAKAPSNATPGPAPSHLTLNTTAPQSLILNLRDYPAWRITRNQTLVTAREQRDDGLIAIPVQAGTSNIDIAWTQQPDQSFGDILTAIAALLLLFAFVSKTDNTQP